MRILIRNTNFFPCKFSDLRFAVWDTKKICGFVICGLIITNLRICVADWHTSEISGFAVAD